MKIAVVAVLAVASIPSAARVSGEVIAYSADFSFPMALGGPVVALPMFEDGGGARTLVRVATRVDASISARITVENNSAEPATFTLSLDGSVAAAFPALLTRAAVMSSYDPVLLGASDGVAGSGPDFIDFDFVIGSGFGALDSTDPETLGAYVGAGDLPVGTSGSGGFFLSGIPERTFRVRRLGAVGTATVSYEYVPGPGGAVAFGAVAACGLIRRRDRMS